MRFPERSRRGDAAHASAIERLDLARERERELTGVAAAAIDTPAASETQEALDFAHDDVAAREAWVHWIERGV
jgi:hypothetical protein